MVFRSRAIMWHLFELARTFQNIDLVECALAGMATLWSVSTSRNRTSGRSNALRWIYFWYFYRDLGYFWPRKSGLHWPVKKPQAFGDHLGKQFREKEGPFHTQNFISIGRLWKRKWTRVIFTVDKSFEKVRSNYRSDFFLSSRFWGDPLGRWSLCGFLGHRGSIAKFSIDRLNELWWIGFLKFKLSPRWSSSFLKTLMKLRSIAEDSVDLIPCTNHRKGWVHYSSVKNKIDLFLS